MGLRPEIDESKIPEDVEASSDQFERRFGSW